MPDLSRDSWAGRVVRSRVCENVVTCSSSSTLFGAFVWHADVGPRSRFRSARPALRLACGGTWPSWARSWDFAQLENGRKNRSYCQYDTRHGNIARSPDTVSERLRSWAVACGAPLPAAVLRARTACAAAFFPIHSGPRKRKLNALASLTVSR